MTPRSECSPADFGHRAGRRLHDLLKAIVARTHYVRGRYVTVVLPQLMSIENFPWVIFWIYEHVMDSAADGSVNSGGDVNEAERHVAFVLFERVPLDRVRGGKDTVLERPLYFSQVFICHRERGALVRHGVEYLGDDAHLEVSDLVLEACARIPALGCRRRFDGVNGHGFPSLVQELS